MFIQPTQGISLHHWSRPLASKRTDPWMTEQLLIGLVSKMMAYPAGKVLSSQCYTALAVIRSMVAQTTPYPAFKARTGKSTKGPDTLRVLTRQTAWQTGTPVISSPRRLILCPRPSTCQFRSIRCNSQQWLDQHRLPFIMSSRLCGETAIQGSQQSRAICHGRQHPQ